MEVSKHCVSCNEYISVDKGMATDGSGQKVFGLEGISSGV